MISTGIIRSIDSLGRVVLPKELRRTFEITTDTPLEIMTEGDTILLRKYRPADACILCGQCELRCPDYAIFLKEAEGGETQWVKPY